MKTHKDLDVWNHSRLLVCEIYTLTRSFPAEERYGLTNQIRRSAISIPSNIAEGSARQTNKEFIHFLYIALGSSSELETQLLLASDLEFTNQHSLVIEKIERIRMMILGLIRHLRKRNNGGS